MLFHIYIYIYILLLQLFTQNVYIFDKIIITAGHGCPHVNRTHIARAKTWCIAVMLGDSKLVAPDSFAMSSSVLQTEVLLLN